MAAVSPPSQNEAGDVTISMVTPKTGPSSDETKDLVEYMRERSESLPGKYGINAYVTGTTALNIDTADQLAASLPKYMAVVVGLALLLLMVVFRSVLVPIKAAAGFLLSIAASMGAVVWVFQDGNLADLLGVAQAGPIVSFLPVLLIGILFGLAMDYEVFLVSRMREAYVHSGDARESVITGYGQSGRVVTAAAVIMTAVFAAFLLDPDPVVKSIGLSLAFGVIADAFIVRMTLVPAVMALLGDRAWKLPRRLERVVPDVDIEGEELDEAPQARPCKVRTSQPMEREGEMTMSKIQIGAVGLLAAALLAAVTIAVWPPSEADKARDDGEQMGQAVAQLYDARPRPRSRTRSWR